MLKELHIKDFILIKNLKLIFEEGFSVLTGETGAGKSILLDSLLLALGGRANYSFVRKNEPFSEVVAIFHCEDNPVLREVMENNYIPFEDDNIIVIRRIITADNKSKSFVNDTPVSVSFLKIVGDLLLDIHGQFDNHKLLNPVMHKDILDSFLSNKEVLQEVSSLYSKYNEAKKTYENALKECKHLEKEKDFIEFSLEELNKLNPQEGEEAELLEQKKIFSNSQRIIDALDNIEQNLLKPNLLASLNKLLKILDNSREVLSNNGALNSLIETLESAYGNISSSIDIFNDMSSSFSFNAQESVLVDERLMDLRTMARKHMVLVDDLPKLQIDLTNKLQQINSSSFHLRDLENAVQALQKDLLLKSLQLSALRKEVSVILDAKINQELKHLKLPNAQFKVDIITDENNISQTGIDRVIFLVKTNVGSEFGALNKIASGGEMARFMLALKIVLSETGMISTMILDEIDIGVGGDVASAIGERLKYLSTKVQTLVITHSHQVASKGDYHLKVFKTDVDGFSESSVKTLSYEERVMEIARMLSGTQITEEAKATAVSLLES